MIVLDLFAGIGGISLGLAWAGMKTVGFCEIDPFCRSVLRKHWQEAFIHDDVRTLTGELVRSRCGPIDLICGGFPCQPVSCAGKQEGEADARWLWPEFARIIGEVRPAWVLAENVPALRTAGVKQGRPLADAVLADLEERGYAAWPIVVGADDVGAPHRRKRVWIVGRKLANGQGDGSAERALPIRPGRPQQAEGDADRSGDGLDNAAGGRPVGWPARPGQPQHGWEQPRLVYTAKRRQTEPGRGSEQPEGGEGAGDRSGAVEPLPQLGVGVATDGLSRRLARLAARRNKQCLKALGNAVVPEVVEQVGLAIQKLEALMRENR